MKQIKPRSVKVIKEVGHSVIEGCNIATIESWFVLTNLTRFFQKREKLCIYDMWMLLATYTKIKNHTELFRAYDYVHKAQFPTNAIRHKVLKKLVDKGFLTHPMRTWYKMTPMCLEMMAMFWTRYDREISANLKVWEETPTTIRADDVYVRPKKTTNNLETE